MALMSAIDDADLMNVGQLIHEHWIVKGILCPIY